MDKLYKRIKRVLHYHEAWADGQKIIEHWGKAGERGHTRQHKRNKKLGEEKQVEEVLSKPIAEGYEPIDIDGHAVLLIEYVIDGMGIVKDLDKRHALEARMNETLGWTGLGHCDGGSIGSGTMDVCCYVVDFKIAKRVIADDLKKTRFSDYSRIYDEGVDGPALPARSAQNEEQGTGPLVPPWLLFPEVGRQDPRWQKGKPAEFLAKWIAWFRTLPADAGSALAAIFPEPKGWKGFYRSATKE